MGIAIEEHHVELAAVARELLADRQALAQHRAMLDAADEALPELWADLAKVGWLGLHLPEAHGGSGYGLLELAVVVEELGRVAAPGPFLPTVVASATVAACGTGAQQASLLPALAAGSAPAGLGLSGTLERRGSVLEGDAGVVLGANVAEVLVVPCGEDMIVVPAGHAGVEVVPSPSLDRGRRVGRVALHAVPMGDVEVLAGARATALRVGRALAAAEAAGGASACSEQSTAYAKVRVAFGRPIGQFQAVKHHCANMFAQAEMAVAAAWDAARFPLDDAQGNLASSVAAAVALPAFLFCSRLNIQVHGGIGFTYEHDAHLYLRRAMSLLALFGPLEDAREEVLRAALAGHRPVTALGLVVDEPDTRAEARAFRQRYESLPEAARRDALIDSGFLVPHWPPPWGRSATLRQQVAIDEELAGIPRQAAGGWLALTLSAVGTPEQQERWVRPALDGSLRICQLFSEPDAGSDLASLTTRAERVEGGWVVNGQKVWTSGAMTADWGYALVRTNPDVEKHAGITVMMIDMNAPGVERRGLRQITGDAHFAEVFLDDVFVPDGDVIGEVDKGWDVARLTMGNERMVIGSTITHVAPDLLVRLAGERLDEHHPLRQDVGAIVAEHHALSMLDLRRAIRALAGGGTGAEGNITKLIGNELDQRLTEVAMRILGPDAAAVDGDVAEWGYQFLFTRAYTLGGGTSEISRNAIGERILGLPRDPRPAEATRAGAAR
ncbi:MAG TPA: acyl-CoA dehydrogenase [Acidimicrobiales bacterium]|nr:acyl-CoA dehydrogenase [Acidimicrobiales bacterium]